MVNEQQFKKDFINMAVDKYFVETWNPFTKLFLSLSGKAVTKEDMKDKLLRESKTW